MSGTPGAADGLGSRGDGGDRFRPRSYMDKASEHLRRQGRLPDLNLLRHVSPLGWDHIVLTGDYDWNSGAEQRSNVRPLNLYPRGASEASL